MGNTGKKRKTGETEEKLNSEEAKGAQEPGVYKPMTHDRFYFYCIIIYFYLVFTIAVNC